jgi:hypothetical protein
MAPEKRVKKSSAKRNSTLTEVKSAVLADIDSVTAGETITLTEQDIKGNPVLAEAGLKPGDVGVVASGEKAAELAAAAPKAPKPNCVCASCKQAAAVRPGQVIR